MAQISLSIEMLLQPRAQKAISEQIKNDDDADFLQYMDMHRS